MSDPKLKAAIRRIRAEYTVAKHEAKRFWDGFMPGDPSDIAALYQLRGRRDGLKDALDILRAPPHPQTERSGSDG